MKTIAGQCFASPEKTSVRPHMSELTPSTKQSPERFQRETRSLLEAMQRNKKHPRNALERPGCCVLGYNSSNLKPVGHVTAPLYNPLSKDLFPNMDGPSSHNGILGFPPGHHAYAVSQALHSKYALNCNQHLRHKLYKWRQM